MCARRAGCGTGQASAAALLVSVLSEKLNKARKTSFRRVRLL
jgi:NifU-like protein involved in Fe-S cluster formation